MNVNSILAIGIMMSCIAGLFFAVTVLKKHVTFKWWIYNRAIRRSRKREWEAYVDYYNGVESPEKWERLLHITELLRRRRDLERWNQWVPEERAKTPILSHRVEVLSVDKSTSTIRSLKSWLEDNTREGISRESMLELIENYAIIVESRNGRHRE